ncbi:MAG: response regulator [Eubacterium sp.]|nr:response regulator [Eubacterium sp.]
MREMENTAGMEIDGADFAVEEQQDLVIGEPVFAAGEQQDMVTDEPDFESEELELEDALSAAMHANKVKADFLANMSYGLRTPLNTIAGLTEIASANMEDEEKVKDCLGKISVSSKYLLSMLNDILDISHMENGKLIMRRKAFSISDMVENLVTVIQSQIRKKDIRFTVEYESVKNDLVVGDDLRVSQMCMRILENAVKYTPMGGEVSLCVREVTEGQGLRAEYEFVIQDNGIGMSEELLEHIYDPFTRGNRKESGDTEGAGLGMTVAKNLVDLMGGTISIDSALGEGTTYTIRLDFIRQNREMDLELPEQLKQGKVLVYSRELKICEAIAYRLVNAGIRAEYVTKEEDVLLRIECGCRQDDAFSLLILEEEQPKEILEKIEKIAQVNDNDLPKVILLSSEDFRENTEKWEITVCRKPIFRSHLLAAIEHLYGKENIEKNYEYDFTGKRVLVVDDHEMNRMVTMEILKPYGILTEEAADGREAIRKVYESPEYYYDLIFMDIQMPLENGYEATDEIRQMQREDVKNVPIVAMTANAFEEDKELAKQHGMKGHISKPVNVRRVLETIQQLLMGEE